MASYSFNFIRTYICAGVESKPKLSELQRLVKPHLAKCWEELGTALGLADEGDGEQLNKIQKNRGGDSGMCFNDTMKLWLHSAPSHQLTWATLIEAVKSIEGLENIGAKIETQLMTSGMLNWMNCLLNIWYMHGFIQDFRQEDTNVVIVKCA